MRRGDDLIARLDAQRAYRDQDRVRAIRTRDAVARTDRVGPTDEGGIVGSGFEVEPTELPQDDRITHEALGLFVAPPVELLHEEHPQDHLNRRGMAPEPPRVGMALDKIGSDHREEFIVI